MRRIAQLIQLPLLLLALLAPALTCGGGTSTARSNNVDASADSGVTTPALVPDADGDADPFPTGSEDADSDASAGDAEAEPLDAADDVEGGPGIDADQGSDADPSSVCPMFCAQERALACPLIDPNCDTFCARILRGPCGVPWHAFFACQVKRPLSDFECSPDGEAVPKAGVCADEKTRVNTCLREGGGPSP